MSIDPVMTDANTGGSFNRYAYAINNSYRYIDPDGRSEREPRDICNGQGRLTCGTLGTTTVSSGGTSGGSSASANSKAYPTPGSTTGYEDGGPYSQDIMGSPLSLDAPGLGYMQVAAGGTLAIGLGVAGGEGAAILISQASGRTMASMSTEALKSVIKAEGGVGQLNAGGIFGSGLPGANAALVTAQRTAWYSLPAGLSARSLQAYRVIAERNMNQLQSVRTEIVNQYLRVMGR